MQQIFLPSLLVVTGVCLFAGLNHLIAWSRRAPDARTHGWFGVMALMFAAYTITSYLGYQAATVDELLQNRRVGIGIAMLTLPVFVFFTIRYARWEPRRLVWAVWSAPLLLFAANLFLPWTIAYRDQPSMRSNVLGDGTIVNTIVATPTYAHAAVWAPVYVFVLLGAWRLWRAGEEERAAPLAVGTGLMLVAAVNDSLVARGITDAYVSEFAFLGLVGLMSVRLSEELVHGAALERALTRSEQRLRLTLDSIAEAVIVVDSTGRVSLMNPAATELTRTRNEEALGKRLEDVLMMREGAEARRLLEQLATGSGSPALEPPMLRDPHGRERHILTSSAAIHDDSGVSAGAVVVLRDVTRERELERRIRETRTMRAIGESAGTIAHEYKNLLAIVLGHAELLAETLPRDDAEGLDSIRAIEEAARRALELSRRALALSPARDTPLTIVGMHEVVTAALRLLGDTLGPDVAVETTLAAPVDTVAGDPEELRSALVNLAINARDAMPGGGRLHFTSEVATITGDEIVAQAFDLVPGPFFQLKVSDTGTGIPERVRERIFEPFFTTKPRGEGTGLGLAAVYSTVTEPGGAIEVHSSPDAGTTFVLWLPLLDPSRGA